MGFNQDIPLESFSDQDKANAFSKRIRASVKGGMVSLLNTGYPEGTRKYYPTHNMTVTLPKPGATFDVPAEVADFLVRMFGKKLQYVRSGQLPANFTPPPGYKLVPVDAVEVAVEEDVNEEDLLTEKDN